jgi:hypothetical protein
MVCNHCTNKSGQMSDEKGESLNFGGLFYAEARERQWYVIIVLTSQDKHVVRRDECGEKGLRESLNFGSFLLA